MQPFDRIDLSKVHTYSARNRRNLVTTENLKVPGRHKVEEWKPQELQELAARIQTARSRQRPVILFMGGHVIKCGLSLYLIDLMRQGLVTHIAGNGAVSIHDFELASLGGTSEDVATAIEDGTFGMWEETGRGMNTAIRQGYLRGLGYGESLGQWMDQHPEHFPHRHVSVIYEAYQAQIPTTFHITIGADIIHQHPAADFAALGGASGLDFRTFCSSVSRMDGGVFLNFGSAVTGAEVFLKALSIARNLGYPTFDITTANFDLLELGDYRRRVGADHPHYYYRPRKNIVNRPTSKGGHGFHFAQNHEISIPNLHRLLTAGS